MHATRPAIWSALASHVRPGQELSLQEVYDLVRGSLPLDDEDHEFDGVSQERWQRNVRNLLVYRRRTGHVRRVGRGGYLFLGTSQGLIRDWTLVAGDSLPRTELHRRYGGSGQGGISPSRETPNVMLFSDPRRGTRHGYIYDGWAPDDPTLFRYTGEGQNGDQRLIAGNRAILDHQKDGRALRVFKGVRRQVRYLGEFELDAMPYEIRRAPATAGGEPRDVLVFRLRPVGAASAIPTAPRAASYRRAVPARVRPSELPFSRDPNALDRALQAHADTQNSLHDFLVANGARPWSPEPDDPDFDLAWTRSDTTFVCEVKSLTDANEDRQLRLGLGQVLDYQELLALNRGRVRAVLAVERRPADPRWVALCERHAVTLVWPETFPALLEPELTAAL